MALSSATTVEALILKATNPLNTEEDPNITQSVCQAIGNETGGVQTAVRLLVHKMQSPQEKEAMQALLVLQASVNNCGSSYQNEIGKFRFLNEMVKLVSPKYLGAQTSNNVKKRVVELLYTWTIDLAEEPKILEAYTMLKKQAIVNENPKYLGAPSSVAPKSNIPSLEDDEKSRMLQRLLQSTRPEDVSKANDLIKNMVKEDERRLERSSRRIVEIETAMNNVKVLDEMLSQQEAAHSVSQADLELMGELNTSCSSLRTNIHRIVSEMDEKDDGLGELIKTCDELFRVMGRYKVAIGGKSSSSQPKSSSEGETVVRRESQSTDEDTLLDLLSEEPVPQPTTVNVAESASIIEDLSEPTPPSQPSSCESVMDQLGDIFSKEQQSKPPQVNLFSSVPIVPTKNIMDLQAPSLRGTDPILPTKEEPVVPLNNLDLLGSTLLQQSLPQDFPRLGSQFKPQEKISLNEMKQQHILNPPIENPLKNVDGLLRQSSLSSSKSELLDCPDDVSLISNHSKGSDKSSFDNPPDVSSASPSPCSQHSTPNADVNKTSSYQPQLCEVKPMSDLNVTLQEIKPGTQSPVIVLDCNGITMTLHFAQNKPRPDVSIVVVTITSKCPQSVTNYTLQAVVTKGCKVRLMPPSSTTLYEFSPFLPPPAITQIMIIANPNELNVSLKAMLSYTISEDVYTEMGEVAKLPL